MAEDILSTPTANQLFKQSNTSLSFKEWIEREKEKGVLMKNALLDDVNQGLKAPEEENKGVAKLDIGIPSWVLVSGVVIIISALVYKRYKK